MGQDFSWAEEALYNLFDQDPGTAASLVAAARKGLLKEYSCWSYVEYEDDANGSKICQMQYSGSTIEGIREGVGREVGCREKPAGVPVQCRAGGEKAFGSPQRKERLYITLGDGSPGPPPLLPSSTVMSSVVNRAAPTHEATTLTPPLTPPAATKEVKEEEPADANIPDNYVSWTIKNQKPRPPITWDNWWKELNYLSLSILTITPAIAIYGALHVPLRWETAVFSVFYYFVTGLGEC